ncbi:unnamed protein product, partial [Boreogadus saida]
MVGGGSSRRHAEGNIACAALPCPTPPCLSPVHRHGDCCPSCGQCDHEAEVYRDGQDVPSGADPCLRCRCSAGEVSCERVDASCPSLPCSHPAKPPGQCCPSCDPVTVSTSSPPGDSVVPAVTCCPSCDREYLVTPGDSVVPAVTVSTSSPWRQCCPSCDREYLVTPGDSVVPAVTVSTSSPPGQCCPSCDREYLVTPGDSVVPAVTCCPSCDSEYLVTPGDSGCPSCDREYLVTPGDSVVPACDREYLVTPGDSVVPAVSSEYLVTPGDRVVPAVTFVPAVTVSTSSPLETVLSQLLDREYLVNPWRQCCPSCDSEYLVTPGDSVCPSLDREYLVTPGTVLSQRVTVGVQLVTPGGQCCPSCRVPSVTRWRTVWSQLMTVQYPRSPWRQCLSQRLHLLSPAVTVELPASPRDSGVPAVDDVVPSVTVSTSSARDSVVPSCDREYLGHPRDQCMPSCDLLSQRCDSEYPYVTLETVLSAAVTVSTSSPPGDSVVPAVTCCPSCDREYLVTPWDSVVPAVTVSTSSPPGQCCPSCDSEYLITPGDSVVPAVTVSTSSPPGQCCPSCDREYLVTPGDSVVPAVTCCPSCDSEYLVTPGDSAVPAVTCCPSCDREYLITPGDSVVPAVTVSTSSPPGQCCPSCDREYLVTPGDSVVPAVTCCPSCDREYLVTPGDSVVPAVTCCPSCDSVVPAVTVSTSSPPGQCCPSCDREYLVTPGDSVVPAVTCCPSCDRCEYDRRVFADGQLFQPPGGGPCLQCRCKGGNVVCHTERCPPVQCSNPIMDPHFCCPICKACVLEDQEYEEGARWRPEGPCSSCACLNGETVCTHTQCPPTECLHPAKNTGSCCAVCESCTYNHRIYGNGQRFVTPDQPCHVCTCQYGSAECLQRDCPAPNCTNPHTPPGECCPKCPDCSFENRVFVDGEAFPSPVNVCERCVCADGRVECRSSRCPRPNCNAPVPGTCCQNKCNGCRYAGKEFPNGQEFPHPTDRCRACTCINGNVQCLMKRCPPLQCTAPNLLPGECCPQCPAPPAGCVYEQRSYRHTERFYHPTDTCRSCLCTNGMVRCQRKPCPSAPCSHPITQDCCPTCEGCLYERRERADGERWADASDACSVCTCRGGSARCERDR